MQLKKGMIVNMKEKSWVNNKRGITLIALVITIIVLLILARNINNDINRGKWDNKKSIKGRRTEYCSTIRRGTKTCSNRI